MNNGHGQGGGAVTVEADAIIHTMNPDLITLTNKNKNVCPGFVQGFLQEDPDFSAPPVFEQEYLLDGGPTENNHCDHPKGGGSYVSKADHLSRDTGIPNHSPHADSGVSNHSAGVRKNSETDEVRNGARAKVSFSLDSPEKGTERGIDRSVLKAQGCSDSSLAADCAQPKKETDLVIEVGGQTISAHKSILAEKSDYFKARQSRNILKVKGMSYKTLSTLIDYIYTSQISVSKDNVVDVITGAKILQIPCAVQAAMDSMSEQVTVENCYEILTIAKKQRLSELKETAYRFMSDNFLQILKDPAVYGRLTGSERDLVLKKRMEGRKTLMVAEVNDVFDRVGSRPPSRCGSRPQSPLSVGSSEESHMIYYFSEAENDWRPLTVIPEDLNTKGCGICTMHNYLFVAGGIKGYGDKGQVSDKVFCYNPVTNRWAEIRPLNQARAQLKLVSMDGSLYAIGGECLFTVEKYDPRMDRWTMIAPLPKGAFAVAHEATTCSGELYVSGGSLFYRLLKYDSKRDEWQECPYNNSRKKSSDMVALKSFIYRFDVNREQGISVFKYNAIVKMWHDCASQRPGSHLPFRCAVIGNCIYCVNKSQTLQFVVEEENAYFVEEPLKAPLEAKGVLFPFVLSLPEKPEKVT
ncbi:kelch repeat and BTB domain-containing protein 11 [Fundulus heteroclitus]|uniref:kelch repeat and BTB domain-containing protein 11 n=1 Tax=Fundulus heteroclitus TaxID=8078 RepID=UPI00165CAA48|nr:kelch repeat and BTB domain-containing protein 11 [Fundulus heteroclitus]